MSARRVILFLLSAVAVAVGGVAEPAFAVSPIFVQDSQFVSPAVNVGLLSVTIEAFSPLATMTVSLYQGNSDALDLPMSAFAVPADDGDGQWGTWTLNSPVTTSDLALGQYTVEVSATDSGGDSVSNAVAGVLYFQNMVLFPAFTSNGTTFDYDHKDVTFSGTATLLPPGGTATPFGNAQIGLAANFDPNQPVTTDANGAFTITVQARQENYWMEFPGDQQAQIAFGATPSIAVTVTQSPVTIQAALAATQVDEGAPDSVNGTVSYTDNGVTKPLTGQAISLYEGWYPFGETPTATTVSDDSGNFAMPVPTTGFGYWSVATPSSPFLGGAQVNLQLTVAQPNAITGFGAKLSSFAVVTYSGCITGAAGDVALEYAAKPAGPWLPLRTASFAYGSTCTQGNATGVAFRGQAIAKLAAAYYRAEYVATPDWQGAVSGTVFLRKNLTKITSFSVTPRSVARNGYITVSGRLWAANRAGTWHVYGHRRVIVVFRYQGVYYRYRHALTTSASGRFSGVFRVYASSPFFAQYNGDSTHFACASRRIRVGAAAAIPLSPALSVGPQFLVRAIWQAAPRMPG